MTLRYTQHIWGEGTADSQEENQLTQRQSDADGECFSDVDQSRQVGVISVCRWLISWLLKNKLTTKVHKCSSKYFELSISWVSHVSMQFATAIQRATHHTTQVHRH